MRDGDLEAAVRVLLPDADVEHLERLRGGERCTVDRVRLTRAVGDTTAVVKRFHTDGDGWVRETAALGTLPPDVAPRLLAADASSRVVVMSDLGSGPTVADTLLGSDPVAAAAAIIGWAEALAALHVAARPVRDRFAAALAERQGDRLAPRSRVTGELVDAADALIERCALVGVPVPNGALDELRGLGRRLGPDGPTSLSPADCCPDDAVRVDTGYRLIDFEGAQWRHVAWDVAYLLVPWPTCWCSWRLPPDVSERAVEAYRRGVGPVLRDVAGPSFLTDLQAAATGWAMTSVTWFLDRALEGDAEQHPQRPSPSRRAAVLHRLTGAAGCAELPALAQLAASLHDELYRRWGQQELDLAPAFRAPG